MVHLFEPFCLQTSQQQQQQQHERSILFHNNYHSQQHGFFHGGVVGALADICGGRAASTLLPENSTVLAVEYKLNLLSPAKGMVSRCVGLSHVFFITS